MRIKKNGKVINLTESDLRRIVKRSLTEQTDAGGKQLSKGQLVEMKINESELIPWIKNGQTYSLKVLGSNIIKNEDYTEGQSHMGLCFCTKDKTDSSGQDPELQGMMSELESLATEKKWGEVCSLWSEIVKHNKGVEISKKYKLPNCDLPEDFRAVLADMDKYLKSGILLPFPIIEGSIVGDCSVLGVEQELGWGDAKPGVCGDFI